MRPTLVALLAAILPFAAVHITLVNSIVSGDVPACFPYFDGCFTISRSARSGDSLHIFRAIMLPTSTLLVAYWLLAFAWLKQLKPEVTSGMHTMRILGIAGSLFLILYATYLGTEGDFYRWMRRYGVTVYFSFTALAQIFFTRRLYQIRQYPEVDKIHRLTTIKMSLCIFQWSIGLISIPLDYFIQDENSHDIVNNIIEWNFALAMHAYFLITYLMYRKTGFVIDFDIRK